MYFHLKADGELLVDKEGCEVADLGKIREHLADVAVRLGVAIDPAWSFEITDESGRLVLILPFSDVSTSLH